MNLLKNEYFYPVINTVAFVAVLFVNFLASAGGGINGKVTGDISDSYPNLFVPPGYVFSIWGIIYLLQFIFVAYQFTPSGRGSPVLQQIGFLFVLTGVLNVSWLLLWHYDQIWLSTVVMSAFLATLALIYLRLDIANSTLTGIEKVAYNTMFSVYFGWISVATVANFTAALSTTSWNGFGLGEDIWVVIMLVVILGIASIMVLGKGDWAYGLVIVWAVAGILVKQIDITSIAVTSGLVSGLVAVAVIYQIFNVIKK